MILVGIPHWSLVTMKSMVMIRKMTERYFRFPIFENIIELQVTIIPFKYLSLDRRIKITLSIKGAGDHVCFNKGTSSYFRNFLDSLL